MRKHYFYFGIKQNPTVMQRSSLKHYISGIAVPLKPRRKIEASIHPKCKRFMVSSEFMITTAKRYEIKFIAIVNVSRCNGQRHHAWLKQNFSFHFSRPLWEILFAFNPLILFSYMMSRGSSGSVQGLVVNNIRNFLPLSFCFACCCFSAPPSWNVL